MTTHTESNSGQTLEPCPFCGGQAFLTEDEVSEYPADGKVWHVTCLDSCAIAPGVYGQERKEDAIRKWNTRAIRSQYGLLCDEHREAFSVFHVGGCLKCWQENESDSRVSANSTAPVVDARLCLLCGHYAAAPDGSCMAPVATCSDDYHGTRRCGCKCKFPAVSPDVQASADDEIVCECHWSSVQEMHDDYVALERQMHQWKQAAEPPHECEFVARGVMAENRDWWIGKLTTVIPEWPNETHCLHMRTPIKSVVFLCNGGDFEQLMVMSNAVVNLADLEWLKSMTREAMKRRPASPVQASGPAEGDSHCICLAAGNQVAWKYVHHTSDCPVYSAGKSAMAWLLNHPQLKNSRIFAGVAAWDRETVATLLIQYVVHTWSMPLLLLPPLWDSRSAKKGSE